MRLWIFNCKVVYIVQPSKLINESKESKNLSKSLHSIDIVVVVSSILYYAYGSHFFTTNIYNLYFRLLWFYWFCLLRVFHFVCPIRTSNEFEIIKIEKDWLSSESSFGFVLILVSFMSQNPICMYSMNLAHHSQLA